MSISTISVRVDSELKKKAEILFKELGLNMTSAIKLFLNSAVENQEIPLIPNEETRLALAEYEEMRNNPEKYKRYDSVSEMMKEILEDD